MLRMLGEVEFCTKGNVTTGSPKEKGPETGSFFVQWTEINSDNAQA